MNKLEKAEQIAAIARESISEFCINECKAYCCKKGYIRIKPTSLDIVIPKNKQKLLEKEGNLRELPFSGRYFLELSNSLGGCPSLKENKCLIHKDPHRPKVCSDFPIFIEGDSVRIPKKCTAEAQNKFFIYKKRFKELGFNIVE